MSEFKGAPLVARRLKEQGIREVFDVAGYPVTPVAYRIQEAGIRYLGTRHEQTAGYAAQAADYLRGGATDLPAEGPPSVNVFLSGARYHKLMAAFGKRVVNGPKPGQLGRALKKTLASGDTGLIHVPIAPDARRARQTRY